MMEKNEGESATKVISGLSIYAKFRNSIVNGHRFFFDESDKNNLLLKIIRDNVNGMVEPLYEGMDLYRARIITEEMKKEMQQIPNRYISDNSDFQSLNEKEIGAPPPPLVKIGRLNPEHISYLYVADSAYCAISETKPEIGAEVAVGTCYLTKDINCISFIDWPSTHFESNQDKSAINYLDHIFGEAVLDPLEYLPMQVIAEYIRTLGYDGVAYSSSQTRGGINYLIFDTKVCKFVKTVQYGISGIRYSGFDYFNGKALEFPKH